MAKKGFFKKLFDKLDKLLEKKSKKKCCCSDGEKGCCK